VHHEIWESTKHLLDDGGELRKTFRASSTFLDDLNYNVSVYCTVHIIYNTVFSLTINMLLLYSKDRLKLLKKIVTVYCERHKKRKCKMCGNSENFNTKVGDANNNHCYLGS